MSTSRAGLLFAVALSCAASTCGGTNDPADGVEAPAGQAEVAAASGALRSCSSVTRELVCGVNGRTYTSICQAGGLSRVAHIGACAGFVCNGVVCVDGFTCKTFTTYGVPVDQCVSDSGTPPTCSCADGEQCVQDPSGATHCEAVVAAPPPPDPATLCDGKICAVGMHCVVTTINYGVPAASCMFD